jgi:tripartite-type tricarboxylate transporter receptor subunit TctC
MRILIFAAFVALFSATPTCADNFPSRPVTVIVPFAAGGPSDALTRIVVQRMRGALGETVLIENATGAGGSIGIGRLARATPDGYTIAFGNLGTHVANGVIYKLGYDIVTDFEPIVLLPSNPMIVVSKNSVPAKSLSDLIAWLKAKSAPATAGTAGAGSGSHIAGLYFESIAGIRLEYVPYRGTGLAMNDLVAGQIDVIIDQMSNSIAQVRAGTIRAYAVSGATRAETAPDVPSVDEAGLSGFHMSLWSGLWAPKGTPKDVIAKLNHAAVEAMADPEVRKQMANLGLQMPPSDQLAPEALGALQKAEIAKWWPLLKAAGVRGE